MAQILQFFGGVFVVLLIFGLGFWGGREARKKEENDNFFDEQMALKIKYSSFPMSAKELMNELGDGEWTNVKDNLIKKNNGIKTK